MVTRRRLPDALAAELIPTGTFGGERPAARRTPTDPDPLAAEHCADLLAALDAHDADRARRRAHLRVVGDGERAAS